MKKIMKIVGFGIALLLVLMILVPIASANKYTIEKRESCEVTNTDIEIIPADNGHWIQTTTTELCHVIYVVVDEEGNVMIDEEGNPRGILISSETYTKTTVTRVFVSYFEESCNFYGLCDEY
jgi:hypothetical protein